MNVKALSSLAGVVVGFSMFLASTSSWAQGGGGEERVIRLVVGEQKSLSFPGLTKVVMGNTQIADVKPLGGGNIILFATGGGRTTMMIMRAGKGNLSYTVVVSKEDVNTLMSEVRKLLGDREGITIRPIGDRVILDGRAFTSEDFTRVQEITKLYPQVTTFVKVNPNARKLVADQLNVELQKAGLKNVEASVVGTKIFLEGSVESKQDLQKAEMITKAVGEEVENLLTVGIKRMVLVEVDFVEIKKQGTDTFGIHWPFDIQGTGNVNLVGVLPIVPSGGQNIVLNWGAQNSAGFPTWSLGFLYLDGYQRVLAQPKLVCASGEKAEFWSGGEVPIVVATGFMIQIQFHKFGVILEIGPTADRHGNIQIDITTEVSDIDRAIGIKVDNWDIPGFDVDRAKTNVTVRHGQTIVLSGLFKHNEQKNLSKVPLFGHIPIIGELFKSRVFLEGKTELCVFVTPRIVNPETPKIVKMISDIKSRYKRARDEVGFSIFD